MGEKPKAVQTADAELKALAAIQKALSHLDGATIGRVVAWVNDRYGPKPGGG